MLCCTKKGENPLEISQAIFISYYYFLLTLTSSYRVKSTIQSIRLKGVNKITCVVNWVGEVMKESSVASHHTNSEKVGRV